MGLGAATPRPLFTGPPSDDLSLQGIGDRGEPNAPPLEATPSGSLVSALGDAIDQLASEHRDTCDIANPSSPQSAVVIYRRVGDRADDLVLADSYLLLDEIGSEARVVTDEREVEARRLCSAPLNEIPEQDTRAYKVAYETCVEELRAMRNQPGGYWIAKDDPVAAEQAITGTGLQRAGSVRPVSLTDRSADSSSCLCSPNLVRARSGVVR